MQRPVIFFQTNMNLPDDTPQTPYVSLVKRFDDLYDFCASKDIILITGEPTATDQGTNIIAFQPMGNGEEKEWDEFIHTLQRISPTLIVVDTEVMAEEFFQNCLNMALLRDYGDGSSEETEEPSPLKMLEEISRHVDEIMYMSVYVYFGDHFVLKYLLGRSWAGTFREAMTILTVDKDVGDQDSDDEYDEAVPTDEYPPDKFTEGQHDTLAKEIAADDRFRSARTKAQREYVTKQYLVVKEKSDGVQSWEIASLAYSAGVVYDMDILPEKVKELHESGLSKKEIASQLGVSLNRVTSALIPTS